MPIDYKKYPKNWLTEIRPAILHRANNKCEICGLHNGQVVYSVKMYVRRKNNGRYGWQNIWFRVKSDAERCGNSVKTKKVKVVLTIAHLDHDNENQNIQLHRLKAMCQKCHLSYDAKEKYLRKAKNDTN